MCVRVGVVNGINLSIAVDVTPSSPQGWVGRWVGRWVGVRCVVSDESRRDVEENLIRQSPQDNMTPD